MNQDEKRVILAESVLRQMRQYTGELDSPTISCLWLYQDSRTLERLLDIFSVVDDMLVTLDFTSDCCPSIEVKYAHGYCRLCVQPYPADYVIDPDFDLVVCDDCDDLATQITRSSGQSICYLDAEPYDGNAANE